LFSLGPVLLLLFSANSTNALAREAFEFTIGDNVHILSDKAFRKSQDNQFEAVGNVVITHRDNAIYGEKASLSFASGETEVVGNVRYVGPDMTMYGSELKYNFNSQYVSIENARIISDNYVVLGKKLSRVNDKLITGEDAEYTTCRDCPESWSVFGRRVMITLGEYVRIWHAYIKVRGVVVMYIPYIILPIKKTRETGLLFPSFGFDIGEGANFRQPWFWAINDSTDLTASPMILGKRGWAGDFQFRQSLGIDKWYEINSFQAQDRIYLPSKIDDQVSGEHSLRFLGDYEHHYSDGRYFTHHLSHQSVNDMDLTRDFEFFTNDKVLGTEFGTNTFFDFRAPLFDINVEAHFNRNQIFSNTKGFDHRYVNILPEVSFSTVPFRPLQTDVIGLNKLSIGLAGDVTYFKQNHNSETATIRNAYRYNAAPFVEWHLGNLGPIQAKTQAKYDYQHYRFPYQLDKSFTKSAIVHESELSLQFEKIFGLAYQEEVPIERVVFEAGQVKKTEDVTNSNTIGKIPTFNPTLARETFRVVRNSYRHVQEVKLKHYLLSNERADGSPKFGQQILAEAGQFDSLDAYRSRQFELNDAASRTTLPLSNTLEIQWNNALIRKTPKRSDLLVDGHDLRDNFGYSKVAYFNMSQGYNLEVESEDLVDKLTRLFVETGFTFNKTTFSASEYYYYATEEQILNARVKREFSLVDLELGVTYDSFTTPIKKFASGEGRLKISDMLSLGMGVDYDLEKNATDRTRYLAVYSPANNCWKLEIGHLKSLTEKKYSMNVLINFNDNSFHSLNGDK
jgi:LPS-assembly protein